MIDLFQHNQKAYDEAVCLMKENGRAAIIHPTGTGKSLIAFKLAEDNPQAKIVWLSPSEYIYQTQLENLRVCGTGKDTTSEAVKQESGKELFENITFVTYSRLMMNEDMIEHLEPDFIVLDEFHRCGAAQWGKSVNKLLECFPEAKVLGLSATNIRYLDNQRDMAVELFDGHIASEITLGEAMARGILPLPKYVIAMYSYQEELEKLSRRVKTLPNKGLQEVSEELLKQMKRALEQAQGLEQIFARHMSKKHGKYIVFCANREHMQEMLELVSQWFAKVDSQPHVYSAYYNNPQTSKDFIAFKEDESAHLKLLFCIDMLNEGVHVADIDGVVLLRPTVSPILYLQQIGRTLATGKKQEPVIFDIVNNFENLYSIDVLKEEIQEALFTCTKGERTRFEEQFQVVDEVWECRQLFERLQNSLSATWDTYYLAAKEYYRIHGNIRMTKNYVTESGLTLGSWLQTQRRVRAGKKNGCLSEEQIQKLDKLDMVWEITVYSWEQGYAALLEYVNTYGDADVIVRYQTDNGYPLGRWLQYIREKKENNTLSEEKVKALEALGVCWDKRQHRWENYYDAARQFYIQNGHLEVASEFVTQDNLHLGTWLANQRRKGSIAGALSSEQKEQLEAIGMHWENAYERAWNEKYELAKGFYQTYGHLDVPSDYVIGEVRLGAWISALRLKHTKPESSGINLSSERIEELNHIGMIWNKDSWEKRCDLAEAYYAQHGHLEIPQTYVTADGIWLGKWLARQRQKYKSNSLPQNRKERLERIGMKQKEYSATKN